MIDRPGIRLDIQGLRALAVVLVVAFHAKLPVPGGFIGVDVFFVISGFVIMAMLQREHEMNGRIWLLGFYARRFKRLTPALVVMVLVTLLASMLLLSPLGPQPTNSLTAMGALLVFANYAVARTTGGYFDANAELNPLLHTWTLSLEEQFYLIFPAILILGWWVAARSGRRGVVPLLVGAVAVLSFACALITAAGMSIPYVPEGLLGFYGPVGRAWEFAAGALLVFLLPRLRAMAPRVSLIVAGAGTALIFASAVFLSGEVSFPGFATLLPVLGALLLIIGGSGPHAIGRALSSRPAVALGDLSYSWYLWHWPLIVFAGVTLPKEWWIPVAAALVSLVPAYVSYRWIEQPIRQAPVSRRRIVVLTAAVMAPALLITGVVAITVENGYWSPLVTSAQASQSPHVGFLTGCMSQDPITDARAKKCTWNPSATGTPVYLVGDSIAEHYSEGLVIATEQTGRPFTIAASSGCPVFPIILRGRDVTSEAGCGPSSEATLEWLDRQPPGLVIIGESDSKWWIPSADLPSDISPFPASTAEKAAALTDGLTRTVDRLQSRGHTVVLAMPPPSFRYPEPSWDPTRCFIWEIVSSTCSDTRSVAQMDEHQGRFRSVIHAVAESTGADVLDLRDDLCVDGMCSTQRGDAMAYRDAIHLSVDASTALAPRFVAFLDAWERR